jgi:hypothetical protein
MYIIDIKKVLGYEKDIMVYRCRYINVYNRYIKRH